MVHVPVGVVVHALFSMAEEDESRRGIVQTSRSVDVVSTPKLGEDKIREALRESLESKERQRGVVQMKRLSVPNVTLGILDHRARCLGVTQIGLEQIRPKRSSFLSWLSKMMKRLALCVVNVSFRPSEADNQRDDEVFAESERSEAAFAESVDPQISKPLTPHRCPINVPKISATSLDALTGPPPKTIQHAVRLETQPKEEQQPATYTVPAYPHVRYSNRSRWTGTRSRSRSRPPRSHSCSSLGQGDTSQSVRPSASLPDLFLVDFEHFTPDITLGGPKETYRLQCPGAGRYKCTATGLVFDVDGEGDVLYSVVPWDPDLLAGHRKRPAGPLFHIECERLTVRQLHLPHCEILSADERGRRLSVGHVSGEGLELIAPMETTVTHVIADISGCSAFGLMRDEDAPLVAVRAMVAIFVDPTVPSIQVFLIPENVVLDAFRRQRARNNCNERFIETISDCILVPRRQYTLASRMEPNSVLIQPDSGTFYEMSHNYNPTFQIFRFGDLESIHLTLTEQNGVDCVWGAVVPLVRAAQRRPGPLVEDLRDVWSEFIRQVSMPVLDRLVDRLFQARVLGEVDRAAITGVTDRGHKARLLLSTVMNIGAPACEMLVTFLREDDPYNANSLGLA
ncbi:uncharacterized protein LOC133470169 isoform X2 [Phyllopteryx taeniolatus]|uniref:uncharacterized protein LOC133470169 isoform X2 n=1 Tax=Phyllopteryx taeniolatus TaxID=161469 RepID=UPI002AD24B76|nr:uncharacterized protein LOC133470169 isoform X2 [Phyllopteryx taeniolatus]